MGAMKALWKGYLSFGLVNIQIEVLSASHLKETPFKLLHKIDLSPIRYARICKKENKEVSWNDIVKGYQKSAGKYAVLTTEDFAKIKAQKTKAIEITQFTSLENIDPLYFETPYLLVPGKEAHKPYQLLFEALKKSGKVGIAILTWHDREHLVVIRPYERFIMMNELRYHHELVNLKTIKLPKRVKINDKELKIALQLIDQMNEPFRPQKFRDTYHEKLRKLLSRKTVQKPSSKSSSSKVHNIMSLLEESVKTKRQA